MKEKLKKYRDKAFFVISGPSGVGKGTIVKELLKRRSDIELSVSYSSRQPRAGEKEGLDYFFIAQEKFQDMIKAKGFLEWAEVHGNFYGTGFDKLISILEKGKQVLFEVDVHGGISLKKELPQIVSIFILPPDNATLIERLCGRGSETPETIKVRMETMQAEMQKANFYDHQVVNDDLNKAVTEVEKILDSTIKAKERIRI